MFGSDLEGELNLKRILLVVVVMIAACGCIARNRLNSNCAWSTEVARPLNLQSAPDRRHLRDDAQLVEELAVRYGDAVRTFQPGSLPDVLPDVRRRREECLSTLFAAVAALHGLAPDQVARAAERGDWRVDVLAVLLPLALLLGTLAANFAKRLYRHFWGDLQLLPIVATLVVSAVAGAVAVVFEQLWANTIEMIRVGDLHLSMRANRFLWAGHRWYVFAGAAVLFCVVVLIRYRTLAPHDLDDFSFEPTLAP